MLLQTLTNKIINMNAHDTTINNILKVLPIGCSLADRLLECKKSIASMSNNHEKSILIWNAIRTYIGTPTLDWHLKALAAASNKSINDIKKLFKASTTGRINGYDFSDDETMLD